MLAISLSLALMLSWSSIQKKAQTTVTQGVVNIDIPASVPAIDSQTHASALPRLDEETFVVQRNGVSYEFIESLGVLKSATFHTYRDYVYRIDAGVPINAEMRFGRVLADDPAGVHFRHEDANQIVTKSYLFDNNMYGMKLQINVQNVSGQSVSANSSFVAGILRFEQGNPDNQYASAVFSRNKKINHHSGHRLAVSQEIDFLALRDRYFCFIVEPIAGPAQAAVRVQDKQSSTVELKMAPVPVISGATADFVFKLYLGPQDIRVINATNPAWAAIIHYGPFDIISHILLQLLDIFYKLVRNWGIAIVMLSLVTYGILFPLSVKQIRSMKEMQKLQPHIEELRKTHKDNPQRLNKEIMELYKAHKVNPLSGCLPILLQMPIFFALYPVLMRSAFLIRANFLWIKDLSSPDKLATIPVILPVLKNEVNVLPILLAILMFLQQRASLKTTAAGTQAEQQKMMMFIMPVMFGFIFYHMPSGLVLYWLVNSFLMFLFQYRIAK